MEQFWAESSRTKQLKERFTSVQRTLQKLQFKKGSCELEFDLDSCKNINKRFLIFFFGIVLVGVGLVIVVDIGKLYFKQLT